MHVLRYFKRFWDIFPNFTLGNLILFILCVGMFQAIAAHRQKRETEEKEKEKEKEAEQKEQETKKKEEKEEKEEEEEERDKKKDEPKAKKTEIKLSFLVMLNTFYERCMNILLACLIVAFVLGSALYGMSIGSSTAPNNEKEKEKETKKICVYTKTGDTGTTCLYNGQRVSKTCDHFVAIGDIDELNSLLGVICCHLFVYEKDRLWEHWFHGSSLQETRMQMNDIQHRLFDVGSHLATPLKSSNSIKINKTAFDEAHIKNLEAWIDRMEADLPALTNFILPGNSSLISSSFHLARAVCRRAERNAIPIVQREDADPKTLVYLNRLADYLFVAARFAAKKQDCHETIWTKTTAHSSSSSSSSSPSPSPSPSSFGS